jgi:hypothetical protein
MERFVLSTEMKVCSHTFREYGVNSDAARARNSARLPKQRTIRTYLLKARNSI